MTKVDRQSVARVGIVIVLETTMSVHQCPTVHWDIRDIESV